MATAGSAAEQIIVARIVLLQKKRKNRIIEQAYRDVLHEKYPELEKVLDSIPKYDE